MRITDVRAIPLHSTERSLSAGPGACLIEIETDSGMVGIGESCTQSEQDEAAVKHLREELGPEVDIMVDVGRYVNWSVSHAIRMAKALSKYNIYWLEEALPQDDVPGYVRLTKNSPVRIAGGEGEYNRYMFERWIRGHAVDIIQPDICRSGGFTEGMRIADMAQFHNVTLVPHGFSTAVSVAANLQFISAIRGGDRLEFRRTKSPLIARLVKNSFEAKKGRLRIPDKAGLGIELDHKIVDELRVEPGTSAN